MTTARHSTDYSPGDFQCILRAVCGLREAEWCFVPVNTDWISWCSQSFLDLWGVNLRHPMTAEDKIPLVDSELGERLEALSVHRTWLLRVCRSTHDVDIEIPPTLPLSALRRILVFDDHRFPLGVLLNCHSRRRVTLANDVLTRVSESLQQLAKLSPREAEIVHLVATGLTNRGISEETGIALKTVEKHRSRAMRKLGANGSADLVRRLTEAELVSASASCN